MKALFLALAVVSSAPGQAWDPSMVERALEAELLQMFLWVFKKEEVAP